VIANNDVGDVGRCSRTYNPALLLEGCGAHVTHNHFHHAPSSAMRVEGNDHLIEYNWVDHVVQESDDQGGFDMFGDQRRVLVDRIGPKRTGIINQLLKELPALSWKPDCRHQRENLVGRKALADHFKRVVHFARVEETLLDRGGDRFRAPQFEEQPDRLRLELFAPEVEVVV